MKKKKNSKPEESKYIGMGIVLGISIGMTIGIIVDDMALWMAIGLSLGLVVGVALDDYNKKKDTPNKKTKSKKKK